MDTIYYFILGILLLLACFDLVVGVSNDAANFLNSAVGSKAASRRTIVIVASIGILLGSICSSGMMEIARSGVFVPGQFYFHDVMMIFLAVMLTDVILLDVFNTYGLPTSTTVSLVFELLGAAVAVAAIKLLGAEPGVAGQLGDYINSSKALAIISGIFSSVVVAFTCGAIIMWISRFIFSFRYKKMFNRVGVLWCGLALTAITYFALFKGLKGSSFVTKELIHSIDASLWFWLAVCMCFWTVVMGALQFLFKINILKIAVLAGTMALALSFAGNDLVNFIGVFMAGASSVEIAQGVAASGGDIATLTMGELAKPVVADWRYLFGAGIIMVLALAFSKRAQTVTETEVNLARQAGGIERFGSVPPARFVVRIAIMIGKFLRRVTPAPLGRFIEKRFEPLPEEEIPVGAPSFDLIRASVNLTVAALLISMATSLKLPLSTTYVTFMVAMGSSLADKAWGRDSAVYRITGVMTVISGWFFTAFAAFTMACIVAVVIMYGGVAGIAVVIAVATWLLVKSARLHKRRQQKREQYKIITDMRDVAAIRNACMEVCGLMNAMSGIYASTLDALHSEDRKLLKRLAKEANSMRKNLAEKVPSEVLPAINKLPRDLADRGRMYIQLMEYAGSSFDSLTVITRSGFNYIDNNHNGLDQELVRGLRRMGARIARISPALQEFVSSGDARLLDEVLEDSRSLGDEFADAIRTNIVLQTEEVKDMRAALLYLSLLNEARSMIHKAYLLANTQREFPLGRAEA